MANKSYKDMAFRIAGNATTALVDITAYINQEQLKRNLTLIEDTAFGDTNRRYVSGIGGSTLSVNGFVNTTTDGIFGPLIQTATSVAKRAEYKAHAGRFYTGSIFLSDVQYSGSMNNMETFSANVTFDGAVTRTSVALT